MKRRRFHPHSLALLAMTVLSCPGPAQALAEELSGLWVGTVTVDGISQPFGETPQELQPVPRPFEFSILVHVDAEGRPRFLKDAVLIADEGGEIRLIANPTLGARLIRAASAHALRHAKRFSSATFSFDGPSLPAEGRFDVGGTVEATIRIGAEDRVNPFVHQFHPDHSASAKRDIVVERDVAMKLEAFNAGHDIATGEFSERVSGLFHVDILTGGRFQLRRIWDGAAVIEGEGQ